MSRMNRREFFVSVVAGDGTILLRNGTADVSLAVEHPDECRAYALATSGRRRYEVRTDASGGCLRFTAAVGGEDGKAVME